MKTPVACSENEETTDSTSWPINRLSYVELSLQDTAAIEKLFVGRSDTPLLMKWVMLHKSGSKFRSRLLVISALHLWVLKHKKTFSKTLTVRREYQLIHLQKIIALRTDVKNTTPDNSSTVSIRLVILPKGHNEDPVMLHFDPGVHTESFVRLLQRQLHALRLTFPQQQTPPMKLPADCHWHEFFPDENDSTSNQCEDKRTPNFAAVTMAYHAFCDDLGVSFRDSVPTRLEECATTSGCMDFQYCLGFPPGVDGYDQLDHSTTPFHAFARSVVDACFPSSSRSVASFQSKEIQALARTLERSSCFSDIIISDLAMGQASLTVLFQALLSPLCTIEGFTLTNVQLSVRALRLLQHVVLQSTMQHDKGEVKKMRLRRLDFSFNRFTVAMATELATILQLLTNGLELLQLERCSLSTVSCCRAIEALTTSTAFSASLLELNIAGNHLGLEGTKSLASWIIGTFALQRLDVSRTQLDINIFVQALKQNTLLHESSLVQLDLSYNQMRTQASQDLGVILGKSQSLATIFLRGMKRYRHFHKLIPSQLQKEGTFLVLSEAAVVAQAAARRNGGTVHRADGLRKLFLRNILAPMFANTDRSWACMVDLSDNDLSGHRAEVLAQLLDESPWTTRTSLRLDHTRLHDKSALLLLHSIRGCKTLHSLSLEGNGFVKRETHRKRKRQNEKCYSDGVAPSEPSVMEQAGSNALALLLGGVLDCNDNPLRSWSGTSDAGLASSSFLAYSSAAKPLRLKELCLKCEGSYVFGTHIITAAVQALAKPHAHLQMLDVTGNECGDALAQVLGDVLPKNKSLQALFWDGNCITVDGFFQFYDGLLKNHTLVMVQMPIQDTRRILEEQKDPPREKLFSILGKIFKATERNQILARESKNRKSEAANSRRQPIREEGVSVHPKPESDTICDEDTGRTAKPVERIDAEIKQELETAGLALERCPSPKLAAFEEGEEDVDRDNSARKSYSRPTSARYPSTMQSWSMQSSTDDFRTQFNKLDSLTASFSLTPSHM
ncbi:hypothetical protein V7S43_004582 [Phytophthora oleae]|uniref:Uncharacterized protein n=1 Tax=Phytophthora oleae TaxID=2107226 RepID=A0ABD3FXB4_9STRA